MNYKITSANVIISLLILASMSLLCHLNSLAAYLKQRQNPEKFGDQNNDPNKIYTRGDCDSCLKDDKTFSRLYQQAQDSAVAVPCPDSYEDPCPDALQSHPKIPEDVKSKCNTDVTNVTGLISGESSNNAEVDTISQEEFDDLLLEYTIRTAKRLPVYPWYSS
jgi:hypothetical protein